MEIRDIPEDKLLRQLAEECLEAAHAALKLIRAHEGEEQLDCTKCRVSLIEEIADVHVTADALLNDIDKLIYGKYCLDKRKRWEERLKDADKS